MLQVGPASIAPQWAWSLWGIRSHEAWWFCSRWSLSSKDFPVVPACDDCHIEFHWHYPATRGIWVQVVSDNSRHQEAQELHCSHLKQHEPPSKTIGLSYGLRRQPPAKACKASALDDEQLISAFSAPNKYKSYVVAGIHITTIYWPAWHASPSRQDVLDPYLLLELTLSSKAANIWSSTSLWRCWEIWWSHKLSSRSRNQAYPPGCQCRHPPHQRAATAN